MQLINPDTGNKAICIKPGGHVKVLVSRSPDAAQLVAPDQRVPPSMTPLRLQLGAGGTVIEAQYHYYHYDGKTPEYRIMVVRASPLWAWIDHGMATQGAIYLVVLEAPEPGAPYIAELRKG